MELTIKQTGKDDINIPVDEAAIQIKIGDHMISMPAEEWHRRAANYDTVRALADVISECAGAIDTDGYLDSKDVPAWPE